MSQQCSTSLWRQDGSRITSESFHLFLIAQIETGLLKDAVERCRKARRGISNTSGSFFHSSIFNTCPIQQWDNQHGQLKGSLCVRRICFVTMTLLNSSCVLMIIMNLLLVNAMLDLTGEGRLQPTHRSIQACICIRLVRCDCGVNAEKNCSANVLVVFCSNKCFLLFDAPFNNWV